jgi:hypothetical protein
MASDFTTPKEDALEAENTGLRQMLAQAGIDASQLLAKAGIAATEHEAAARLQRLLLEELHHRVKNTLATVMAITSQSLKNATSMEQGREAIAHRLIALGRVSIGAGSGPQIGIQKGPPRFALRTISVRPVGAGRGCGDGASAG